jgi:hypothetical protein
MNRREGDEAMAVHVLVFGGKGEGKSSVARRIERALIVEGLRVELRDDVGTKEDAQVWARPGEVSRRLDAVKWAVTKGPHVTIATESSDMVLQVEEAASGTGPVGESECPPAAACEAEGPRVE